MQMVVYPFKSLMTGPFWHYSMGVAWDRAIFSTLCQRDAMGSAWCPETWENPLLTIINDVNYNRAGLLPWQLLPWHPTLSITYTKESITYTYCVCSFTSFYLPRKEGKSMCLYTNWAPLNKAMNPLTAAEKQLSVEYKRMWYIRRLQGGECECVWPSSYSKPQPWQSGVNRNVFLGNFFVEINVKTEYNQGRETILHLFLIVFSPLVPYFPTWKLISTTFTGVVLSMQKIVPHRASQHYKISVTQKISVGGSLLCFVDKDLGILTHQVSLTCSMKRAGTKSAE